MVKNAASKARDKRCMLKRIAETPRLEDAKNIKRFYPRRAERSHAAPHKIKLPAEGLNLAPRPLARHLWLMP
jgi:hypothetical protein